MIIDAVRLPVDVERGVVGGPEFNTIVLMTDGGQTKTQQNWSYPLYRGDISYGIQSKDDFSDVLAFFYARRGRARGFLFKDWSDFEFAAQGLGTGDGSTTDFQVVKTYSDTVLPFSRKITRPISSSMTVYKDGVAQAPSAWSRVSGGIVRFTAAPAAAVIVTATGEFDIPMRFSTDMIKVSMNTFDAGEVPSIGIQEVRE